MSESHLPERPQGDEEDVLWEHEAVEGSDDEDEEEAAEDEYDAMFAILIYFFLAPSLVSIF